MKEYNECSVFHRSHVISLKFTDNILYIFVLFVQLHFRSYLINGYVMLFYVYNVRSFV